MDTTIIEPKSRHDLKDLLFKCTSPPCQPKETDSKSSQYSETKKYSIVFVISWIALTMTFSSTAIFSATEEIANTFATTRAMIDLINAVVFVTMSMTSFIWSPLSLFVGRKMTYNLALTFLLIGTIATACSSNVTSFFIARILAAFGGTYLLVAAQTIITDLFEPCRRGLATGCLMVGCLFGPALGPCLGGLIVTYSQWRVIFWTQVTMAFVGLALSIALIPAIEETRLHFKFRNLALFNPYSKLAVLMQPRILLTCISSGLLGWLQYFLLVSPRHLINPRFNLTTPLVSGLFYLSPGFGFILGALLGGRLADRRITQRLRKNQSAGTPQDRLRDGLWATFGVVPAACLVYGWTQQFNVGGLACPVVAAFFCAMGIMFTFTSLNLYCAEALPKSRAEVIMTKYLSQYAFGAAATASAIPMIDKIGAGFAFTTCAILIIIAGGLVVAVIRYSPSEEDLQ